MTKSKGCSIIGIATETSRGVKFMHLHYFFAKAVSEQWFEKARVNGPWSMVVIFNPVCIEKIQIVNREECLKILTISCDLIKIGSPQNEKLNRYYTSIQELKKQRKAQGKKRFKV